MVTSTLWERCGRIRLVAGMAALRRGQAAREGKGREATDTQIETWSDKSITTLYAPVSKPGETEKKRKGV